MTYTAYLQVDNQQMQLRPGMTASATISTADKQDVLLVPNSAFRFRPKAASESDKPKMNAMMPPPHRRRQQEGQGDCPARPGEQDQLRAA